MGIGVTELITLGVTPVFQVIISILGAGILFVIAKVLGGKGSYSSIFYLASLYAVPLAFVSWIPIVSLLASLYSIYLIYLVIKISQDRSSERAIATVLIPIILVFIVVLISIIFLIGSLAAISGLADITPTGLFGL